MASLGVAAFIVPSLLLLATAGGIADQPRTVEDSSGATLTKIGQGTTPGDLLTLTVQDIPVRFRWCPPGKFQMGSAVTDSQRYADENKPVTVTLTQGFWMMETECWQKLWVAVTGDKRNWKYGNGDLYPAYYVSHDDSVGFGRRVTKLLRDSGQLNEKWEAMLPTSAQWEYAARAGTTTRYCFGDDPSQLDDYAWHTGNSDGKNHPVGTKKPNAWGLYDVHGSVWEWCGDRWDIPSADLIDPKGPAKGLHCVNRGGSWLNRARDCRSGLRNGFTPDLKYEGVGFRLALVPSR